MMFSEYESWVIKHCPEDTDVDGFVDYLAMIGATIMDNASKNSGKSVQDLIAFHFSEKNAS